MIRTIESYGYAAWEINPFRVKQSTGELGLPNNGFNGYVSFIPYFSGLMGLLFSAIAILP